jgi:hypothetical protein
VTDSIRVSWRDLLVRGAHQCPSNSSSSSFARRASCEVSARFFASYAGGYAIWLLYGLSVSNAPLIVVDLVGLLCAGLTLAVALSLRGSLIHPSTWKGCDSIETAIQSRRNVPGS